MRNPGDANPGYDNPRHPGKLAKAVGYVISLMPAALGVSIATYYTHSLRDSDKDTPGPIAVASYESDPETTRVMANMNYLETDMDRIVDSITGRDIDVLCASIESFKIKTEDGMKIWGFFIEGTEENNPTIVIDIIGCAGMLAYTDKPYHDDYFPQNDDTISFAIDGVLTLGHEIEHANGTDSEGLANCAGVYYYDRIAEELSMQFGVTDTDELTYSRLAIQPAEYHSEGC